MLKSTAAARAADAIAVHPYTGKVKDVKKQIKLTRKVMNRAKLRKTPIWVTEIGWGEGKSSNPLIVSAAKQRKNLRASFQMMLKESGTKKPLLDEFKTIARR
jgi:exo-beta-1,3-glucanase (GH17 family)